MENSRILGAWYVLLRHNRGEAYHRRSLVAPQINSLLFFSTWALSDDDLLGGSNIGHEKETRYSLSRDVIQRSCVYLRLFKLTPGQRVANHTNP